MKKRNLFFMGGIIIFLSFLLLNLGASPVSPSSGKKWEYCCVLQVGYPSLKKTVWICAPLAESPEGQKLLNSEPNVSQVLNFLGSDCWELISTTEQIGRDTITVNYYFKRPK